MRRVAGDTVVTSRHHAGTNRSCHRGRRAWPARGRSLRGVHRNVSAHLFLVRAAHADRARVRNDRFAADAVDVPPSSEASGGQPAHEYVEQLEVMKSNDTTTLHVDFNHVLAHDEPLAEAIELEYYRFEVYLRRAVQRMVKKYHPDYALDEGTNKEFFISFFNLPATIAVRDLRTDKIGTLVSICGTVTRTSEVRPELLYGAFKCHECATVVTDVEQQFKYTEPTFCRNPLCTNQTRWTLETSQSKFVDWQRVRVQENSDEIPPGSLPRSVDVILRHASVERAKAGDKCTFTGSLIVVPDVAKLYKAGQVPRMHRSPANGSGAGGGPGADGVTGLKALGVRDLTYRMSFLASSVIADKGSGGGPSGADEGASSLAETAASFSPAERASVMAMRRERDIFNKMVNSVAPTVFGHEAVKKGILLMLFGGVHKKTPESMRLRGDINVCLVGDPSTAKSQFLKYTCQFMPRAVYTSGKASSSAGLTASVVRDPDTGEFGIEAGALMLADNAICCIDEFDKMDPQDQVAIHEAMEQQTISITKAGLQATLNARTSILAAANPIFGRYDRSKTLRQNVDISPPIMSRFDLFFVVVDDQDPSTDRSIAEHIVRVHQRREEALDPPFSMELMQRYVKFARALNPIIKPDAEQTIVQAYLRLRSADSVGSTQSSYRVTVRQLESLVRLSEAMARLHLDDEVRPAYVLSAEKLLRKSIITVETGDVVLGDEEAEDIAGLVAAVEAAEAEAEAEELDASPRRSSRGRPRADSTDEESEAGEESKKAADAAEPVRPAQITFDKYQRMANMMAMRIRQVESAPEAGVLQGDVVGWYLDQLEDIDSEEALAAERVLVNQVIRRLVMRDNVFIYVTADAESLEEEARTIAVHPNFVLR